MKPTIRRARRVRSLLGLICLVTGAMAGTAMACSCGNESNVQIALEQADAVFAGRVIALKLAPRLSEDPTVSFAIEDLEVTVAVHSRWKGEITAETLVYTAFTCCVCGFPFQIGEEYLIYALADDEGKLRTSICSQTALLANASDDLGLLGNLSPASLKPEGGESSP